MVENDTLSPSMTLFVGDLDIEFLRLRFEKRHRGLRVNEARDLRAALAFIRRARYDAVVIELAMKAQSVQTTANWLFLRIKRHFPETIFALFGERDELDAAIEILPLEQRDRLGHYIRVRRNFADDDVDRLAAELNRLRTDNPKATPSTPRYRFEVALSFAHEDRAHAEELYRILRDRHLEVFYDDAARANTVGGVLPDVLQNVYENQSRLCVVFASRAYTEKPFTLLELGAAQLRASRNPQEHYVIPVIVKDNEVVDLPGLSPQIAYFKISMGIDRIAAEIERRLGTLLATNQDDA